METRKQGQNLLVILFVSDSDDTLITRVRKVLGELPLTVVVLSPRSLPLSMVDYHILDLPCLEINHARLYGKNEIKVWLRTSELGHGLDQL